MSDKELIELLRRMSPRLDMLDCEYVLTAADRIEEMESEIADLKAKLEKAVRLISEKPILATYEDDVQWQKYVIAELSSVSCANTTGGRDE